MLQVAAFAQLAVVGRGINTCIYVLAIFTMFESNEQRICIKVCFKDVQFHKNIVAGEQSWVYGYDRETKQQSSRSNGPTFPRPKKGR